MFDQAAPRYDLMNTIISLGMDKSWRAKAIDLLGVKEIGFYLDVGCGTGDQVLEIARRFPQNHPRIIGIDQSRGMLEIGKKKLGKQGCGQTIELTEGDALKLPYPDESTDGIISAFVFRNLDDRMGALKEWFRVLKKGGCCVILELSRPPNPFLLIGYQVYTRLFVPLAGALFSRIKNYQYLINSIASFPSPPVVREMMQETGFSRTEVFPLLGGVARIYRGVK
jgi:demethylmenaquinone methyltransferase/2-methoxy-6-polyprenyl-1,4-benzoquinol methylase